MVEVIGVRFRTNGKIYFFNPLDFYVEVGDHVIVETVRGVEYGTVVVGRRKIGEGDIVATLKPIIRIASEKDDAQHLRNQEKCKEAFDICLKKIEKHKLEMKLIDAEYTFDNNKLLFYFSSDGRVDFRELVRDLANEFRTRIELRQIGVRDEAKLLGGLGICGRELCCYSYLSEFASVSIKMAKEQNLSLNPSKISGVCGRLMCCLKNEQETYEELNSNLPAIGDHIKAHDGTEGEVQTVNVLRQKVRLLVTNEDDQKEIMEYSIKDLEFTPHKRNSGGNGGKGKRNKHNANTDADVDMKELESLEKDDQTKSKLD